jgi:hypothetical protein
MTTTNTGYYQMVNVNKVACVQVIERSEIIVSRAYNAVLSFFYAIILFQQRARTIHVSARQQRESRHQAASKYVHVQPAHPIAYHNTVGSNSDATSSSKLRPIPKFPSNFMELYTENDNIEYDLLDSVWYLRYAQ